MTLVTGLIGCSAAPTQTADRFDPPTPVKTIDADGLYAAWPNEAAPEIATGFGRATAESKLTEIRELLMRSDPKFIKGWRAVLADPGAPATELHGALVELMAAITGPAGLWRKTIPQQWLGCRSNPESKPCRAFAGADTHFAKWDRFQRKLDRAPSNPKRFLVKSHGHIMAYTQTYVPDDRSFSAARRTPFFREHLEEALRE